MADKTRPISADLRRRLLREKDRIRPPNRKGERPDRRQIAQGRDVVGAGRRHRHGVYVEPDNAVQDLAHGVDARGLALFGPQPAEALAQDGH